MSKNDLEQKAFAKITEYMVEQNRPYSATDVYTNLRQEFGKTLVLKVLESCAASGTLKEKMIGKQKIFYANQENLEVCDEAAIADFDSQIGRLSEELKSLTAQNKEIQNDLKDVSNKLTTKALRSTIAELQRKIGQMKSRLASLEKSKDPLVAENGRKVLQMESLMLKTVEKRKRIATDMINTIMENSPMSKKELLDSIGIELDGAR